ncbi:glycosyltransferase [Winogradskyella sp. SYSU M77433]|uniref:glycosyltransferase n=1 Tax=Winogradskyella sp. SYSU M77433 TaxID=3042722 RepID=UPI00248062BD|nr:glycosyltransferase [Winogradskyella sp. SYSU M77433]MDH7911508.1 glycosyltransferase [Winogradskyella sp. SYSU M77433]
MAKKKLLIMIDWFLPAYKAGGPIQSVANLINYIKEEFDVYVATSNSDIDQQLDIDQKYLNIWIEREGYKIVYIDSQHQTYRFYKNFLLKENFDVIYFNSIFSKKFTLIPLILYRNVMIRKVLAPRGMLGKGALSIKPIKKKLFLSLFKVLRFHRHITWHATAESEMLEIKKCFGDQSKVLIAPNLSGKINLTNLHKVKEVNKINVFFLSRISFKKNLLSAIKFLSEVNERYHINFSIIGPIEEEEYWKKCKHEQEKLPQNISVKYLGAIQHSEIVNYLKDQHVLLLPTHHENFGHVIMESWQNGCPVIISDQTPWKDLEKQNIGFDIPIFHTDRFVKTLDFFAAMDNEEFSRWSSASIVYAKKFTENPELLEQNKTLFLNAINI